jgi:hypothetical protein
MLDTTRHPVSSSTLNNPCPTTVGTTGGEGASPEPASSAWSASGGESGRKRGPVPRGSAEGVRTLGRELQHQQRVSRGTTNTQHPTCTVGFEREPCSDIHTDIHNGRDFGCGNRRGGHKPRKPTPQNDRGAPPPPATAGGAPTHPHQTTHNNQTTPKSEHNKERDTTHTPPGASALARLRACACWWRECATSTCWRRGVGSSGGVGVLSTGVVGVVALAAGLYAPVCVLCQGMGHAIGCLLELARVLLAGVSGLLTLVRSVLTGVSSLLTVVSSHPAMLCCGACCCCA